jgi:redox-sensitive bicupin YhaK (pirin superfamily)
MDDSRKRNNSPGNAKASPIGGMHGFHLWANLPAALKMTAPRYQEFKAGFPIAFSILR